MVSFIGTKNRQEAAALCVVLFQLQSQIKVVSSFSVIRTPIRNGRIQGIEPHGQLVSTGIEFKSLLCALSKTRCDCALEMSRRDYEDDGEDEDFAYARLRRRRWRDREGGYSVSESGDERDATQSTRRSNASGRSRGRGERYEGDEYDEVDFDDEFDDDEDEFDDDEDDYEDEYEDVEEYNGVIPNVLLDQIDPDGAVERIPQLMSDPSFYRDVGITVVLFLIYAFGRLNNPLYDIKDVDKIDFSQFYN